MSELGILSELLIRQKMKKEVHCRDHVGYVTQDKRRDVELINCLAESNRKMVDGDFEADRSE